MKWIWQNAHRNAAGDAARHSIINHACSSAKNAVRSAYACLQATTETKVCAPATTTGRPSVEAPNALKSLCYWKILCFALLYLVINSMTSILFYFMAPLGWAPHMRSLVLPKYVLLFFNVFLF